MAETATEIADHDQIIRESFIEPIRTVTVIDDEFPTLDSLIAGTFALEKNAVDVKRVREILDFARSRTNPWLVDVHDGKNTTSESETKQIAPRLHHSDLMVLDYHLNGDNGSGEAAIEILRSLAQNDHYNLVIVYTKGYDGDLKKVIREVALGLTFPGSDLALSADEEKKVRDDLENWEVESEGITTRLISETSADLYLQARSRCAENFRPALGLDECIGIKALFESKPQTLKLDREKIVRWLLRKKQDQVQAQFSKTDLGRVQFEANTGCNWVCTEKLFVTVISKSSSPAIFEEKLLAAIKASFPSPHRLLVTKMRCEIDKRGLVAESAILGDTHVQTAWLNDFLNPAPADEKSVVASTISRHWEALGDQLRDNLDTFGDRLRATFRPMDRNQVLKNCGLRPGEQSTETLQRYNCFVSTKPFDRAHLTTGHTLKMGFPGTDGQACTEHWICLSPACDMVPGQKDNGWNGRLGNLTPFIAVRLHCVSPDTAVKNATRNVFLFLEIDGSIQTFSIHPDGSSSNSPDWEQMFAADNARFHSGRHVVLTRMRSTENGLSQDQIEATVTAQLRSEYALNLLQRIGALLSRPGLGMNFKGRA